MNNVYNLFALIMENLGQVAGKIDGLYSQLSDFEQDMGTALSSINDALNDLADLPDAVATIENRLDALDGGAEPGDGDGGGTEQPIEP